MTEFSTPYLGLLQPRIHNSGTFGSWEEVLHPEYTCLCNLQVEEPIVRIGYIIWVSLFQGNAPLLNRFMMRPAGVVSKKDIGALKIVSNVAEKS